jgi:hypothetical protein
MSAADPTLAVALYLKAQAAVNAAAENRFLRPELLGSEDAKMPRAAVVVRPAGGGAMSARWYLPMKDSRLDIVCYGSTRLEAENIAREVSLALQNLRRSVWGEAGKNVLLMWARLSAEPTAAAENEVNWPYSLISTQVLHGAVALP